jgi:hypothetical protein
MIEKKRKLQSYAARTRSGSCQKITTTSYEVLSLNSTITAAECNKENELLLSTVQGDILLVNFKYYTPKHCNQITERPKFFSKFS